MERAMAATSGTDLENDKGSAGLDHLMVTLKVAKQSVKVMETQTDDFRLDLSKESAKAISLLG